MPRENSKKGPFGMKIHYFQHEFAIEFFPLQVVVLVSRVKGLGLPYSFLSPNIFLPEIIEILITSQNRPGKQKQFPTWVSPIDLKKTQKRQKFPVSKEI